MPSKYEEQQAQIAAEKKKREAEAAKGKPTTSASAEGLTPNEQREKERREKEPEKPSTTPVNPENEVQLERSEAENKRREEREQKAEEWKKKQQEASEAREKARQEDEEKKGQPRTFPSGPVGEGNQVAERLGAQEHLDDPRYAKDFERRKPWLPESEREQVAGGVKVRILTRCNTEVGTFYKGDTPLLPGHEAERLLSIGYAIDLREELQPRTQGEVALDEERDRRSKMLRGLGARKVTTTIEGDQGEVAGEKPVVAGDQASTVQGDQGKVAPS